MGAAASAALPSSDAVAAPPPPPSPAPLAELPGDLQQLILDRIPCPIDLARMSAVCRAWRDMIAGHRNLQRPLPLLLLPADVRGVRAACITCGARVHHTLDITPSHARFFGTYEGSWVFLATLHPRAHVAVNVHSGDTRDLPTGLLRRTDPQRQVHGMVIHAVAFSSSPEEATCVGAAIVTSWSPPATGAAAALPPRRRCIAFWRQDGLLALDFAMPPGDGEDSSLEAQDVIYLRRKRSFAFLTSGEHLRICTATVHGINGLETTWTTVRFRPTDHLHEPSVRARYLVMSGGELLMVVRFTPSRHEPTHNFKVFLQTERDEEKGSADPNFAIADYPCEWTEQISLDGRVLFVGHGCSRSYRAEKYPGVQQGIYFLDDGEYFDDAVIFTNVRRYYPCSDNGRWSEGHVERCFPRPKPSDHSAPVWLLP